MRPRSRGTPTGARARRPAKPKRPQRASSEGGPRARSRSTFFVMSGPPRELSEPTPARPIGASHESVTWAGLLTGPPGRALPGRRPAGVDSGGALLASGRTAPPLRLRRAARGRDRRRAPPRPGGDRTRRRAGAAARREPRVGAGDAPGSLAGAPAGSRGLCVVPARGPGSGRPGRANGPSTCRTST